MARLSGVVFVALFLGTASWSMAFEDSYDCHSLAETSIGWDSKAQKYSAQASTSLQRPAIVKLSDLNAHVPLLTGQGVTPLSAAGTIVDWTLVEKPSPFSPPHATLVSTKTYDLFGPATFTALYRCVANRPSR